MGFLLRLCELDRIWPLSHDHIRDGYVYRIFFKMVYEGSEGSQIEPPEPPQYDWRVVRVETGEDGEETGMARAIMDASAEGSPETQTIEILIAEHVKWIMDQNLDQEVVSGTV